MKKNKKFLFVGLLAMLMIAFLAGPAISTDSATIMGIVKDGYILTDNDQVYYIGEGGQGDEVMQLEGKKVRVTGTIEDEDETKIITVTSYDVIEK